MTPSDRDRPLYMISVAAELAGVHPQTLRIYENKGLIKPKRSKGNTRMYSQADIDRLELVSQLTAEGINLAGVMRILDLQSRLDMREAEVEKLRRSAASLSDKVHELEMRNTITSLVRVEGGNTIARWKE
jgi:MerR family transcriptional regulator, heat shock protein HspR